MDWAYHEPQIRFDIRAEREDYEHLFNHEARVLKDRLVRRGRTDRTRKYATLEWEIIHRFAAQNRKSLHQARVLSWGKEKKYYFAHTRVNAPLKADKSP